MSVDVRSRRSQMPLPVLGGAVVFAALTVALAVASFAYAFAFNSMFATGEAGRVVSGIAGAVLLNIAIVGTLGLVQRWRSAATVAVVFGALVGTAGLVLGPFAWWMAPGLASAMLLALVPSGVAIAVLIGLPASARRWFSPEA